LNNKIEDALELRLLCLEKNGLYEDCVNTMNGTDKSASGISKSNSLTKLATNTKQPAVYLNSPIKSFNILEKYFCLILILMK